MKRIPALILLAMAVRTAAAQDGGTPAFAPMLRVGKVLHGGDSIQYVELNKV